MIHRFPGIYTLLLLVLAGFSGSANAVDFTSDAAADETIVTADSAEIDQANSLVRYQGNVVIEQSWFRIKAEKVTYSNRDGVQIFECEGDQVHATWQQPDDQQVINYAKANYIRYVISTEETLTMRGRVSVQIDQDRIESEHIFYDFNKALLKASGNQNQRVRFVITEDR